MTVKEKLEEAHDRFFSNPLDKKTTAEDVVFLFQVVNKYREALEFYDEQMTVGFKDRFPHHKALHNTAREALELKVSDLEWLKI